MSLAVLIIHTHPFALIVGVVDFSPVKLREYLLGVLVALKHRREAIVYFEFMQKTLKSDQETLGIQFKKNDALIDKAFLNLFNLELATSSLCLKLAP